MEAIQLNIWDGLIIDNIKSKKGEISKAEVEISSEDNAEFLKGSVEETINACKPLVGYMINSKFAKYRNTNIREDLYQCGDVGVYKAYSNYKDDGRCIFKTYVCTCIKNEIQNFLDSYIGRKGLSKYDLNNGGVVSLDEARGNEDDEINLYNSVSKELSENYKDVERKLTFDKIINHLKENEKVVIQGLLQGKTQTEIAKEINLSDERVSKIKQAAFNKMRYLLVA